MLFTDRSHAGKQLATALAEYAGREDVVLLALPKGGVPVAAEVAAALGLPLDIMLVRKLGVPGHEEYAMGAIAPGDLCCLNWQSIDRWQLNSEQIDQVLEQQQVELLRCEKLYRAERAAPDLQGKTVIVIDDCLATGATMRVATDAARKAGARSIVSAVPVGAARTCQELAARMDQFVCPHQQASLRGAGLWYGDFRQITDTEVAGLLQRCNLVEQRCG